MVKNMYKENAKSQKSAIVPALLWVVFMYVFYILWGIGEILLDIKSPVIIKHVILWLLTSYFAWILISKFLIEFEFAIRKNEFTITRILGKKSGSVCTIKYESIIDIYTDEEKDKIKNYKIHKKLNFIRAFQKGNKVYIVYRFKNKLYLLKLKASTNMLNAIKENITKKKGDNI